MVGAFLDVVRFEQALAQWDDVAFVDRAVKVVHRKGNIGAQDRAALLSFKEEYRKHLLQAVDGKFDERFLFAKTESGMYTGHSRLGQALFQWCKHSRVVYSIDDDLRLLLHSSRFDSGLWREIPWPFQSFVVTLDKPVETDDGVFVDTILFAVLNERGESKKYLSIFLPVGLDDYKPGGERDKERLLLMLKRGNLKEVERIVARQDREMARTHAFIAYSVMDSNPGDDVMLGDEAEANVIDSDTLATGQVMTDDGNRARYYLARMTAALACYIASLPPAQVQQSKQSSVKIQPPIIKRDDPRLVSTTANVFRLASEHKLTPDERGELEQQIAKERTGMMIPHPRRGHFRRPPGSGNDPNAPRTVWVHETIVNRKHLPDMSLPGGTHVKVKAPKDGGS